MLDGETAPEALISVTFRITSDGDLLVMSGQEVVGRYGYRVTGDRLDLWSAVPGMDCFAPEIIVGEYTWWLENGAIRFTPVDDACPGRADVAAQARLKQVN